MELITDEFWSEIIAKVIVALIIVVVAVVASKLLQMPIKRLVNATDNRRMGVTIFQNIVRVLVWGWAICEIAYVCFGWDMAGVLGALGIVGVAVSLGAQQTISNIIGGVIVSLTDTFGPGDWVTVQGHTEARIVDTDWRCTMLEDENGVQYAVPNSVMVSNIVQKGNAFYTIVVPFSLRTTVPDIEGLLSRCEQVLLDRQVELGLDYEKMRPKAHVEGASLGAIQAQVKVYANRAFDTRVVKRAMLPALINFLQQENALATVELAQVQNSGERAYKETAELGA